MKFIDISGQRFGRLMAEERAGRDKNKKILWRCVCDCGNEVVVCGESLHSKNTQSCGCIHKERLRARNYKHNGTGTRLYLIWVGMRTRCNNSKATGYKYYGGKGIKVSPEWQDFARFRDWALSNGYADNLVIDRLDSYSDYSPGNCCWITPAENTRKAVVVRKANELHDEISLKFNVIAEQLKPSDERIQGRSKAVA